VIIGDLDLIGVAGFPTETDPPLVVDPDAPLAGAVPGKLLEPVAGGNTEKFEGRGAIQLFELSLSNTLEIVRQLGGKRAVEKLLLLFDGE
jgi:hypothetical protein